MEAILFDKLNQSELQTLIDNFELGIDEHIKWLGNFHHTIICDDQLHTLDVDEQAHKNCQFGRWFYGLEQHHLDTIPDYENIERTHRLLHDRASEILRNKQDKIIVDPKTYETLLELDESLRSQLQNIHHEFQHSQKTITRLMSHVFANASEGVIITDPDTHILSVNKAFTDVTGYTADEVIGKTTNILSSHEHGLAFYEHLWCDLREHGQWSGEITNRRRDGNTYLEYLAITAVHDEYGEVSHYVGIFTDISRAAKGEEWLYRLAHYDALTQLPNRLLFEDRLNHALAQARRNRLQVATMFLDLDGFKKVNDELGHQVGDQLLIQVAERIKDCLRESDTVGRFGGDEFTVVLSEIEEVSGVDGVANKIIEQVARPYDIEGHKVQVTTSVGISLYPQHGHSIEVLIKLADTAMYRAKREGKNRFKYHALG